MNKEFDLNILTPNGAKIKTVCYSLSYKSHIGELVIYGGYEPFISTIDTCKIKILTNTNQTIVAVIGPGIIKVFENQVTIMTDFFQSNLPENANPNKIRGAYIDGVIRNKLRSKDVEFEALHNEFAEEVGKYVQEKAKNN
jgi:F0F1-type ATP synthase epsilon subunit